MTNSAFQSGDVLLKMIWALAHTRQDSFNTCINYWQSTTYTLIKMTNSAFQSGDVTKSIYLGFSHAL